MPSDIIIQPRTNLYLNGAKKNLTEAKNNRLDITNNRNMINYKLQEEEKCYASWELVQTTVHVCYDKWNHINLALLLEWLIEFHRKTEGLITVV